MRFCQRIQSQTKSGLWDIQLDLTRDLHAAHAGHREIEQDQIDVGLSIEEIQRSATTAYLQHDITKIFQDRSCDFAYGAVVIHNENYCPFMFDSGSRQRSRPTLPKSEFSAARGK